MHMAMRMFGMVVMPGVGVRVVVGHGAKVGASPDHHPAGLLRQLLLGLAQLHDLLQQGHHRQFIGSAQLLLSLLDHAVHTPLLQDVHGLFQGIKEALALTLHMDLVAILPVGAQHVLVGEQVDGRAPPLLLLVPDVTRRIHLLAQVAVVAVVQVDLAEQRVVEEYVIQGQ